MKEFRHAHNEKGHKLCCTSNGARVISEWCYEWTQYVGHVERNVTQANSCLYVCSYFSDVNLLATDFFFQILAHPVF